MNNVNNVNTIEVFCKDLKTKTKNDLIIKFGKQLFENCFDTSIDKTKYSAMLENYSNNIKNNNKKYYIYSSFDKKLLIFSNGMNKCYKTVDFSYKNEEKYRIEHSNKKYLANDLFQSEYEYDTIFQYNEKIFELQLGISIVFIEKTNMKTKNIQPAIEYSIEIRIKHDNIDKFDINLLNCFDAL